MIWAHLETVLAHANMSVSDLVSLRFYLAAPADDRANVAVLQRRLGDHHPARTEQDGLRRGRQPRTVEVTVSGRRELARHFAIEI